MKKHLLTLLALLVLPLLGRADSAGDYVTATGDLTVTTSLSPSHNQLSVTLSRNGNTSPSTNVTANPQGGTHDVLNSPDIRVDGGTFKWENGRLKEKQADGTWKTLKKKKKTGGKRGSMEYLRAGDVAPHDGVLWNPGTPELPLLQGDVAPYSGYFSPGDDVVSLPTGTSGGTVPVLVSGP